MSVLSQQEVFTNVMRHLVRRAGLLELVAEGSEHLVEGRAAGAVVALEEPVVEVVVLVRLEVVLPPTVRGCW